MKLSKRDARTRRRRRIRSKISGNAERPRVAVCRSNRHIQAQAIDDKGRRTVASVTTVNKETKGKSQCNRAQADALGRKLGEKLKEKGITQVVFDRGGYLYHGVVKAFADGLRAADEKDHFHF